MTKTFVTGTGRTINIGCELGKGGEGSVYEVLENDNFVAKLYNAHHQPDAQKQEKLRFMALTADNKLLSFAAWPIDTIHKNTNGPVVGFLMPKVSSRLPIHMVYSPAQRKQNFPYATWDFLLLVARNTAAAFASIHEHGHVIGDVNQGNVLVGNDGTVMLIDTDSFQINANGTMHLCKVGVPHFTPPELQGLASFDKTPRTINHDNFGLALLIFHLLFSGRHPYAGIPLRNDVGESLENDIKAFRYAYAPDGQRRGFKPPPKSVPINIIPDYIQNMFTWAFTEKGVRYRRPTAQQWITALDDLRKQLKSCSVTQMHRYPNHLNQCPWCALDAIGAVFFLTISYDPSEINGFDLARACRAIESVLPPPEIQIPNIDSITVRPTPLPERLKERKRDILFLRILIVVIAIIIFSYYPEWWIFLAGGAWWGWIKAKDYGSDELDKELTKRRRALEEAQREYDRIIGFIEKEVSHKVFEGKKQELKKLIIEYKKLPELEEKEISNLYKTAENRQKQKFLEKHFIDDAVIPGVGPAKKATLKSFGIETAADVTWSRVISVKGFGKVLTRNMVNWRDSCEKKFVFNKDNAVTEADKNAVRAKIAAHKRSIEMAINKGIFELQRLRQDMIDKSNIIKPRLHEANQILAQAKRDLEAIESYI